MLLVDLARSQTVGVGHAPRWGYDRERDRGNREMPARLFEDDTMARDEEASPDTDGNPVGTPPLGFTVTVGGYWLGFCLCHGRSDRSPSLPWVGTLFCWRCWGIILGSLLATVTAPHVPARFLVYSPLLLLPSLLDGGTQAVGRRESGAMLRLSTGLLLGMGIYGFGAWLGGLLG